MFTIGGGCTVPPDGMDPTSFTFTRTANGTGTDISSYFTVAGVQATASAAPLVVSASNAMQACISWTASSGHPFTICSATKTTYMNPTPAPTVDPTPYVFDAQDLGRCAQACFAATASLTTVPYFALGQPQSVTLAYHQDRVDLRPLVFVNVTHPGGAYNTPTQFWLEVQATSPADTTNYTYQTFTNGETRLHFAAGTQTVRLGGQLRLDLGQDTLTGAYKMKIIVTSQYSGTQPTVVTTVNTRLVVVNERQSPLARGWTVAGLQHLYQQADSSVVITDGTGSAVYFNHPGAGAWTTPSGEFSKVRGDSGYFRRLYPDSTRIVFDNAGRMTQYQDRFGNTTALVYDGSGRLIQINDPLYAPPDTAHRRIVLVYGTNGLTSIADGFGRTTNVYVNGTTKQVDSIGDPDGVKTKYAYDGSMRLVGITNRAGNSTRLGYDSWWRVSRDTLPAVSINGGAAASPITQLTSWQEAGVPLTATSGTAATPPKADTIHAKTVDPEGNVASFTANRWGEPLGATNPVGETTTMLYDANGLPARVARPNMAVDTFSYNADGFLTYARVGGHVTTHTEGGWALPAATGGDGPSVVYHIVSPGAIDRVTVASTVMQTDSVDRRGRARWNKDASGHTHRFVYDTLAGRSGQVLSDSAPSGIVTQFYYDALGRDTATNVGALPARVTHYDVLNRTTATYDTAGAPAWTFTYDSLVLKTLTNPRGLVRYQTVNALGWVTATWTSATGSVKDSTYYDYDGRVTQHVNRRGQRINFAYDSIGRVTRHWATNGAGTTTYTADTTTFTDASLWVRRANGVVTDTLFLDNLGRVTSVGMTYGVAINHHYGLAYTYLANGLVSTLQPTVDAGQDTLSKRAYGYNGPQSLVSIQFGAGVTHIGRNLEQRTTSDTLPTTNTLVLTDSRNVMEQFTQVSASDGFVNVMAGRGYLRDSLARAIAERGVVDTNHVRGFTYNRAGQLAAETFYTMNGTCSIDSLVGESCPTNLADSSHTFAYDPLGNRTDHSGVANLLDQLTSFNGHSYTYDADGNLIADTSGGVQVARYYWSPEELLDTVQVGSTLYSYRYDAGGRLVRRSTNNAPDRAFLWEGARLLAELRVDSVAGTVTLFAEYSWYPGLDVPHAVRTAGGAIRYFVNDGLGNVSGITGGSKPVVGLRYDAWGVTVSSVTLPSGDPLVGDTIRPRWKGAFLEVSTGLYYLRNRWYDPKVGRFISEDPSGLAGGSNAYAFALGDPVDMRDPRGLNGGDVVDSTSDRDPCKSDPSSVQCVLQQISQLIQNTIDFFTNSGDWQQNITNANMGQVIPLDPGSFDFSLTANIPGDPVGVNVGFNGITIFPQPPPEEGSVTVDLTYTPPGGQPDGPAVSVGVEGCAEVCVGAAANSHGQVTISAGFGEGGNLAKQTSPVHWSVAPTYTIPWGSIFRTGSPGPP